MKLLFFIHSLGGGGAERVTATLANHWAGKGWDVSVVTLAPRDRDRYDLDPAVARIALDQVEESTNSIGALVANWRRIAAVRNVLKRERPDVVVAMMATANVVLALASVGLSGMKKIGSERVHPPLLPLGFAWELLRSWCYGWLDAIVAQTNKSRDWVISRTSARRVVVIPNPVEWPLDARAPMLSPDSVGSPHRKRLLAVGRLEYQKGLDILIEVFGTLAPRFPDWELVILGEGSLRAELHALIQSMRLGDVVFLPGDAGNIGEWYSSAALYVSSSRFEGFPNALTEAMAHGLPAVSFDCDTGPGDIIRHEVDGLLIAPGDTAAFTAALDLLMRDEAARARLGARAVDVRTRFALDRVSDLWLQLFAERA